MENWIEKLFFLAAVWLKENYNQWQNCPEMKVCLSFHRWSGHLCLSSSLQNSPLPSVWLHFNSTGVSVSTFEQKTITFTLLGKLQLPLFKMTEQRWTPSSSDNQSLEFGRFVIYKPSRIINHQEMPPRGGHWRGRKTEKAVKTKTNGAFIFSRSAGWASESVWQEISRGSFHRIWLREYLLTQSPWAQIKKFTTKLKASRLESLS